MNSLADQFMSEFMPYSDPRSGQRLAADDVAQALRAADHAPPSPDDRAILAGAGRPASARELREFLAREQSRISERRRS